MTQTESFEDAWGTDAELIAEVEALAPQSAAEIPTKFDMFMFGEVDVQGYPRESGRTYEMSRTAREVEKFEDGQR